MCILVNGYSLNSDVIRLVEKCGYIFETTFTYGGDAAFSIMLISPYGNISQSTDVTTQVIKMLVETNQIEEL